METPKTSNVQRPEPLPPSHGSAAEDWQTITITTFGYWEIDCNSGKKRYLRHDFGYKFKVRPPNTRTERRDGPPLSPTTPKP